MTIGRGICLGTALLAALSAGCAVHEPLGRPPSLEEIALINANAAEHGPLRVEPIVPVGSCAGGGCSAAQMVSAANAAGVIEPVRVAACDGNTITFTNAGGVPMTAPLADVGGVSTPDRGRSALIGAVVGGTIWPVIGVAGLYLFASLFPNDPGAPVPQNTCDACFAAKLAAVFALEGALIGAGIGALAGGRHVFDFGGHVRKRPVNDRSAP